MHMVDILLIGAVAGVVGAGLWWCYRTYKKRGVHRRLRAAVQPMKDDLSDAVDEATARCNAIMEEYERFRAECLAHMRIHAASDDSEVAHDMGDGILIEIVRRYGYDDVADAWQSIPKYV